IEAVAQGLITSPYSPTIGDGSIGIRQPRTVTGIAPVIGRRVLRDPASGLVDVAHQILRCLVTSTAADGWTILSRQIGTVSRIHGRLHVQAHRGGEPIGVVGHYRVCVVLFSRDLTVEVSRSRNGCKHHTAPADLIVRGISSRAPTEIYARSVDQSDDRSRRRRIGACYVMHM